MALNEKTQTLGLLPSMNNPFIVSGTLVQVHINIAVLLQHTDYVMGVEDSSIYTNRGLSLSQAIDASDDVRAVKY